MDNDAGNKKNRLYIAKCGRKGRGVFTSVRIRKNEVVEICPVVPLTPAEAKDVNKSVLYWHLFIWPAEGERYYQKEPWTGSAMVLGYGSVYNHSYDANMKWYAKRSTQEVVFYAIREISPGEELTHDYKWDEYPWEKQT